VKKGSEKEQKRKKKSQKIFFTLGAALKSLPRRFSASFSSFVSVLADMKKKRIGKEERK